MDNSHIGELRPICKNAGLHEVLIPCRGARRLGRRAWSVIGSEEVLVWRGVPTRQSPLGLSGTPLHLRKKHCQPLGALPPLFLQVRRVRVHGELGLEQFEAAQAPCASGRAEVCCGF